MFDFGFIIRNDTTLHFMGYIILWFQSSSFVRHLESNVIFILIQTLCLVLFMGNQGENIDLEM